MEAHRDSKNDEEFDGVSDIEVIDGMTDWCRFKANFVVYEVCSIMHSDCNTTLEMDVISFTNLSARGALCDFLPAHGSNNRKLRLVFRVSILEVSWLIAKEWLKLYRKMLRTKIKHNYTVNFENSCSLTSKHPSVMEVERGD